MIKDLLRLIKKILFYPRAVFQERKELAFYSQFVERGDLCFDIGANIGGRTNIFLKLGANVVAVEPQELACRKINKLYGNNKNLIIVNKGLASEKGFLELSVCADCSVLSTMSEKWKKEGIFSKEYEQVRVERVLVDTLDNLIAEYGLPKFCKIDVEGFELDVLKGLSKQIPYISFEFTKKLLEDAEKCVNYLISIGRCRFNFSPAESGKMFFKDWVSAKELFLNIEKNNEVWGDIYAKFATAGKNRKTRLHLGCGHNILPGYINIDKGGREGVKYDFDVDILDLKFDDNSVDKIRLHHVFEHFHRYQAIALMFAFNNWLKLGGRLIIETPDFEWCARKYLNLLTLPEIVWSLLAGIKHKKNYFKSDKWRILRHIFGSKEAGWANHLEGWDRFTLSCLYKFFGFKIIGISQSKYKAGPVPSITITGEKQRHIKEEDFKKLSEDVLKRMAINDFELPIWMDHAVNLKDKLLLNKNLTQVIKNDNT